jgi:hypothetical protein
MRQDPTRPKQIIALCCHTKHQNHSVGEDQKRRGYHDPAPVRQNSSRCGSSKVVAGQKKMGCCLPRMCSVAGIDHRGHEGLS